MMTTSQAAAALDVSIPVLQRAIRKSGLRMRLAKRGTDYLFSPEDLDAVSQYLSKPKPVKNRAKNPGHGDTPGLPLEWLNDPAHTADFVAERYRREARLISLIRGVNATA
ncbi:helix-turn-helix domain-containing protein [Mycolicibacter sinensis]|uniref:helix-turn-helix domain-containing protein n=1 Tax=Mycolicibacter sinensis (strain JDM601) TaxID=875328 RepID=UPI0010424FF4|nr:helix-turn-helix domain-containing protein [Mycolicibacter sinensis]